MDRKIIVAGHISYDITPQIYDTKGKNVRGGLGLRVIF